MSVSKVSWWSRLGAAPILLVPLVTVGDIVAKKLAPLPVVATRVARGTAACATSASISTITRARAHHRRSAQATATEDEDENAPHD